MPQDQLRPAERRRAEHPLRADTRCPSDRHRRPAAVAATALPLSWRQHPSVLNAAKTGGITRQTPRKADRRFGPSLSLRDDGLLVTRLARRVIPSLVQTIRIASPQKAEQPGGNEVGLYAARPRPVRLRLFSPVGRDRTISSVAAVVPVVGQHLIQLPARRIALRPPPPPNRPVPRPR